VIGVKEAELRTTPIEAATVPVDDAIELRVVPEVAAVEVPATIVAEEKVDETTGAEPHVIV